MIQISEGFCVELRDRIRTVVVDNRLLSKEHARRYRTSIASLLVCIVAVIRVISLLRSKHPPIRLERVQEDLVKRNEKPLSQHAAHEGTETHHYSGHYRQVKN